jgi:hypothetical protein
LTRRSLLGRAVAFTFATFGVSAWVRPSLAGAFARHTDAPLTRIGVRNAGRAFAGDRARFATVNARSGGARRTARLALDSDREVDVIFEVASRHSAGLTVHERTPLRLPRGSSEIPWTPGPTTRGSASRFSGAGARVSRRTRTR